MDLTAMYYLKSELLEDDIDITAMAIKELTHTKRKTSYIKRNLENLRLRNLESELVQLCEISKETLKAFYLHKTKINKQTTIYDFL